MLSQVSRTGVPWGQPLRVDLTDLTDLDHYDGLVQERHNSSALAMELRLSCTYPSIYGENDMTVKENDRVMTNTWKNKKLQSTQVLLLKRMPSYQYMDSHYKDKMNSWPSYFYDSNLYTWRDSLYIETVPRSFNYPSARLQPLKCVY